MQGQLLNFSSQENIGYILGDDGKRYQFLGDEWKESALPQKGDRLDFGVNATGQAVSVFLLLNHQAQPAGQYSIEAVSSELQAFYETEARYNMFDWFVKCMKNYFNFSGRARRKEFWYFQLCCFILNLVLWVLGNNLMHSPIPKTIFWNIMFIPLFSVSIRRLHDINRSEWWAGTLFLLFATYNVIIDYAPKVNFIHHDDSIGISLFLLMGGIALLGFVILLTVWCIFNTKNEVNKWGPPAKPRLS